ncbi:molybdopterin molybdotransferase MoeA [Streptomyces pinistramenti]|uniref:molybdopterin molybdotransferase MoeA n=1 Tax=Streptomyces pinistramenti TaxID=2884812 RepID=UPI001D05C47D|nr:molybdopterin molybdotransferase MoeA [Streptomyces pinistramenti]MCB5911329.1 molybdopterin molybdenumtransferase MoeA [Streptomyces pinistramenti]
MTDGEFDDAFADALALANGDRAAARTPRPDGRTAPGTAETAPEAVETAPDVAGPGPGQAGAAADTGRDERRGQGKAERRGKANGRARNQATAEGHGEAHEPGPGTAAAPTPRESAPAAPPPLGHTPPEPAPGPSTTATPPATTATPATTTTEPSATTGPPCARPASGPSTAVDDPYPPFLAADPDGPAGPGRPSDRKDPADCGGYSVPSSPWHVAREIARKAAAGPRAPETTASADALGRTLAAPLTALTDLPSFDTSAMDGWAVSGPGPWFLDHPAGDRAPDAPTSGPPSDEASPRQAPARRLLAGHASAAVLADGHAMPIATGARVPAGATAVLRSEHGEVRELGDGRARLSAPRPAPLGQDIRPRGQECGRGDQLLPAGTPVTPAVLGLAAAAGYDELTTSPRPQVEVLVLGDELLRHGLPQDGRIRDALGPMLGPWLRSLGADVAPPRHLTDDPDTLHAAVSGSTADIVITTGGTASGPVDHVHPTLRRLGAEVLVDGVQVRPGHPMLLARLAPGRHLVGLPGNPLAAVSGLLTLAEPLLRTLAARRPALPCRAPLGGAVQGHPHDTRLVPVVYHDDMHGLTAQPLRFHGPAMLRGIAAADALAVIPPGGAERGTEVGILEFPWPAGGTAGGQDGELTDWSAPGPARAPDAHPGAARPVRSTGPAPPTGGAA